MAQKTYSPIVQELIDMIAKNGWEDKFQKALDACHALNTIEYENIKTLEDYYDWLEGELHWIRWKTRKALSSTSTSPCSTSCSTRALSKNSRPRLSRRSLRTM